MKYLVLKKGIENGISLTILLSALLCCTTYAQSLSEGVYSGEETFASLGYFRQTDRDALFDDEVKRGLEASAVSISSQNVMAKFSATFYSNSRTDSVESGLFGGMSVAGFYILGEKIQPYAGLGLFFGKLQTDRNNQQSRTQEGSCSDELVNDECDVYLTAVFPEVGVVVDLGPVMLNYFARIYYDSSDKYDEVYVNGISIGWRVN